MKYREATSSSVAAIANATAHNALTGPLYALGAVGIVGKCLASAGDEVTFKVRF